jgi:hypothetical protein
MSQLLGFWFGDVGFDGVNVFLVGAFTSDVNSQIHLLCFLFADACCFEFVWAKSLADFLLSVLFGYYGGYVVHLPFSSVMFTCAPSVAGSHFFCTFAFAVV